MADDAAYGRRCPIAAVHLRPEETIEIVKRTGAGFELLRGRWAIERTLGPLNRNWRLGKDFEATLASATTWIYIASVYLLVRRLARLTQVIEKVLQLLRS